MGVNHSTKGTETVNAINNLALITGNIGRAGAAPFSITGQCNAMGTREAGFASIMPGYRKFESAADREELAGLWNIPVERIPTQRGLAYPDIIEAALEKKIRALWIIATNPIVSFPNLKALQQAFEGLEFLVVQDCYHPTPTSEYAHLMLPAAVWGEKEGTYTNSERRVSKVNRAVSPPAEAKSDFDIFLQFASALGVRDEIYPGWTKPADAFEEWKRVSAGRLCDYSGITYKALEQHGGDPVAVPRGRDRCGRDAASLHRRRFPYRRWQGTADSGDVGALPRAAERRVSVRAQHRPDRGALAHANEDGEGADPRAAVAARLGRDESARRARAASQAAGSRGRRSRGAAASAASSCA